MKKRESTKKYLKKSFTIRKTPTSYEPDTSELSSPKLSPNTKVKVSQFN
jgi:hypothetical protein